MHGGHVPDRRRPAGRHRQLGQDVRAHDATAADPHREHRRRRQRDGPAPRAHRPALGGAGSPGRHVDDRLLPRHLSRPRRRRGPGRRRRPGQGRHRAASTWSTPTTPATSSTPAPTGMPTSARARSTLTRSWPWCRPPVRRSCARRPAEQRDRARTSRFCAAAARLTRGQLTRGQLTLGRRSATPPGIRPTWRHALS